MFWWSAYYMFWYVNGLKLSQEHFELHGSREREGACFTWRGLIHSLNYNILIFFTENNRMRFHREMIIDVRKFDYKFYLIVAKIPGAYHIEMG